ncbi:acyl-CoA dehydrogenase family protein [Sphingosinicella microcystinivorans]|uniref:acyl-CoA dehydrogenase family protein n=1 Tax=Sphingosinicella microcystinivorans TaxID=335406 RepID=UPI0022F383DC|nr:acyl-CoA dehydrogenase family protein [Sphingosinicella microcystinivorans]WBX84422.1 acyl-CoA dehydrogenase family protein [Sphingosinicella microcystinivorans]
MSTGRSHDEILRTAVRKMLAEFSAPVSPPERRWRGAVDQGLTMLCAGDDAGLQDLLPVMNELGRAASPLPVLEAAIANIFAPGRVGPDERIAIGIGRDGEARYDGGRLSGTVRLVEGAADADRLMILCGGRDLCILPAGAPGVEIAATPALLPGLADVHAHGVPCEAVPLSAADARRLVAILRLGFGARALGAAQRGFEMVVDYARVRRQFGQTIGSFQALQHKLANSHIALEGCRLQMSAAAQAHDCGSADWWALATSAAAFAGLSLRQVALETQHCFGAVGFAEEHEAPALFRRVHGDVARCGGALDARLDLGRHVLNGGAEAIDALFAREDDPAAEFRARLRAWLDANWSAAESAAHRGKPLSERNWNLVFAERLGRDGWAALNWPKAAGGLDATPFEQLAFSEELLKAGVSDYPLICGCRIMAPEIIAHGTPELQAALLPGLRAGTVTGCLGYSEPEAGSDLASLRTKAVRDGDDYVINGQKIWTTDGHRASHMILAARTHPDPDVRHGGISLFILPMDSPGITVRPMMAMYGQTFCNIFFDDVRLPPSWRLGEENGGWKILSRALANERIAMGGFVFQLRVLLEALVDHFREAGDRGESPIVAEAIGRLTAELVTGGQLALNSIALMNDGGVPLVEAAMAKVYASELAQRLTETALDLVGGEALLGAGAPGVPAEGAIEQILRTSIMYVVGGGSNEIQRSMIAQRGLGLGR